MYIYTYTSHEDEASLCELELRSLFDQSPKDGFIQSTIGIPIDRSPFLKRRIDAAYQADHLDDLISQLPAIELSGYTFKVLFTVTDEAFTFEEQRQLERTVGAAIRGKAEMRKPDWLFGLTKLNGKWSFGPCEENSAIWLAHIKKPQNYSTALPTRAARAIVNIAAGQNTSQLRMIDPCCGMGTVLIEAMSMGIDIEGMELNPLAARGARINLAHFGYPDLVRLGDMRELIGSYDAAIVDMPYNLCSVLPEDEQLVMLKSVRRMAKRAVIVTTEPIDLQLLQTGWQIIEGITLSKASFTRYITVVK